MSVPATTARQTPSGWKMPDGYQSLIAFSTAPSIKLWEKSVKPPGLDGGEGIDTSTMFNLVYRTKSARHLVSLDNSTMVCAYDPDVYADILNQVNREQAITVIFPDHSTLSFFGFLQKAEPGELKEGTFPEITITIVVTNWDPVAFVEQGPVFTAAAGT